MLWITEVVELVECVGGAFCKSYIHYDSYLHGSIKTSYSIVQRHVSHPIMICIFSILVTEFTK